MEVSIVVSLGQKYLTEEILGAFKKWGTSTYHRTCQAAGDIVGWYCPPGEKDVEIGSQVTTHGSLANSLYLGRRFLYIRLTMDLCSLPNPQKYKELSQYHAMLLKIEEEAKAELLKIGMFVKNELASAPP